MTITIMDGGMGTEIRARLPEPIGPLWATRALIEQPELVLTAHNEFIEAGARLIITCSYSAVPSYLEKEGIAGKYVELTTQAARIARRAADESPHAVQVAGSLPPLDESYRPDRVWDEARALPVYENITRALSGHVDLYLCETMSTIDEARMAATTALSHGNNKPVWVSWTIDETPGAGLRSGESVAAAIRAISDLDVATILFNCSHPEAIEAAISEASDLTDLPTGGYANRLASLPKNWTLRPDAHSPRRADIDEAWFAAWGQRCAGLGAKVIGGCCGISPREIRALADSLS